MPASTREAQPRRSISGAGRLKRGNPERPLNRPALHCACCPCDDAIPALYEWVGRDGEPLMALRLLRDGITEGNDEPGVLLMGMTAKVPGWS